MPLQEAKILNGPEKFDLFLAFFSHTHKTPQSVLFVLAGGIQHKVFISGIEREDGSSQSWILTGKTENGDDCWIYYHSGQREGHIKPHTPEAPKVQLG